MMKVANAKTLRLLTKRLMQHNRARNRIAVIAIMLTSLLFTSLFTGSVSMILSKRATEIKQFMDSSHAIAQNLSDDEADRLLDCIKQSDTVARYGTGMFLGSGVDKRFGFSTEVRYADENMAESFNCVPTTGRLPQSEHEIAVSSIVLHALGISPKLGSELTLTWETGSPSHPLQTDTFTLCGYWEGDKAVIAQMIWVSETYADAHRHAITKQELQNGIFNGCREYCVWYHNLWNLEKKTQDISRQAGFSSEAGLQANPAYNMLEEDTFSYSSVAVLIAFVILAGYLIIYNIFSISVKTDIRIYGLLKNIGTTGRQLKKIVRMQAWRLSAVGIPIGLLLGYGAGVLMAPSLSASAEIDASSARAAQTVVSAHPLIFVVAALLTLLTVYLSCLEACRFVARLSPVDALRMADGQQPKRKHKHTSSASWWAMAIQNLLRSWKKGCIVMLSIALSLVVVNCIVMLVQGYDFASYQQIFLASDFQLDQVTASKSNTNFTGISPETRALLDDCPDSEPSGYVYYSEETHEMEPQLRATWETLAQRHAADWTDEEKQIWEKTKASGKIKVHLLGINKPVFDKLEWSGTPCSWEQFQNGSVIVDYGDALSDQPIAYYQVGDTLDMTYASGKSGQYTVCGTAQMPYALDYPYADAVFVTIFVPEEEFIAQTGITSAMYAALDAKDGREQQVQDYIENTVLRQNDLMNLSSVLDMQASFERYVRKYYTIGGFLVVILTFIGIMNFFNTTAASVLSRRRELALLEAVGMTKSQQLRMLIAEGCIYLIGAFVMAVVLVITSAEPILSRTIGRSFFFQMHLTIVPCVLLIPFLLLLAYAIPRYQFQKLRRESIVQRLRQSV